VLCYFPISQTYAIVQAVALCFTQIHIVVMIKRFLIFASCMLIAIAANAQEKSVSGVIKDATGNPVAGITVTVKGTRAGAVSNAKGEYRLTVPEGGTTLVFRSVGYKTQEIVIGDKSSIDVKIATDAKLLDEVVVTGVSEGTQVKKLGFAISKVSESTLKEVPAVDAANALRGKASGVQIVQSTGIPGTAPDIRLRGATNIQGNSSPLIVIDGILTPPGTSLADINMNDVASIEIVKGAAGASLYGSQAGNGVIQIITKRGAENEGATDITLRSEWGITDLQKEFPVNRSHRWELNPDGAFRLSNPANPATRVFRADQMMASPFPGQIRNHQRDLLVSQPFNTNYISLGSTQKNTNFLTSFERLQSNGILQGIPAFERLNARLNVDQKVNERFKISTSFLYSSSSGPDATERTQGGPFYGVLLLEPDFDVRQKNPDGTNFYAFPGRITSGNNGINPLYSLATTTFNINRNRLLGNVSASYAITDWLRVEAQTSYDRLSYVREFVTQKNTYNTNMSGYNGGGMNNDNFTEGNLVATGSAYINKQFDDFNFGFTLRYQYEQYNFDRNFVGGSVFAIDGVPQLQNLDRTTLTVLSEQQDIRAENIFANLKFDYKDKYIIDALVRRDGSSLFGINERYQFFYRGSLSYRLNEDLKIPGIQEWKLRASYGTSGQRPVFRAQYETFELANGVAVKRAIGNANLRPTRVGELEFGMNLAFLDMFNFEVNYAQTEARDQILRVPLFGGAGFSEQFQNSGTMRSTTIEFSLGADLIKEGPFKWNFNLTGYQTRAIVAELGRPPFSTNGLDGQAGSIAIANSMFRIEAGQPFGAMFGNQFARSLSALTTNSAGFVNNLAGAANLRPEDFVINSDGYVIRRFRPVATGVPAMTNNEGSVDERPFLLLDPVTGQPLVTRIGDSNPDFIFGFTNTISYENLSLYFVIDAQLGGNVYNATRQLLYFNERHADLDQAGKAEDRRKRVSYYTAGLYNGNNPTSHFVERGDFVAVREINLSYRFDHDLFENIGLSFVRDVRLSIIGRNLFMFSDYSGYNPEVAYSNNSVNFRVDQFTYPVFRTFTGAIQVRF
jgi:TonB-linked SusC/RagA family outer membrane protein